MENSAHKRNVMDVLQKIIFGPLLVTDGRTTDLLETMLNEKVRVQLIRQEQIDETDAKKLGQSSGAPYYIRESILVGEDSGFVVSHNIAVVYSKNVPQSLFESIANQQEGIGKVMSSHGMRTFRQPFEYGWIHKAKAADLFQRPVNVQFSSLPTIIPYKKYYIYFGQNPGIQMVEYFNPDIIPHRLQKDIKRLSKEE
ncbi:chorismate lyase [Gracilibacillus ureilyticus]|uniref:Chorismate lyase n=1 Tax=Gracilibacillus ureilyticus TaxID=531814 RepID=A0A1H9V3I2_9BACI|nr:chorismate pyruvate-lyase family protein [Gracilibacillus ureilyticus]SES16232.1 chorismate lyase [Gracilibacillus ureilyticus]